MNATDPRMNPDPQPEATLFQTATLLIASAPALCAAATGYPNQ